MEVTDLLGFPLRDFFPVQKVSTGIYERSMAPPIAAAPKGRFSRTDPLSSTRTSPRGAVRIEEGKKKRRQPIFAVARGFSMASPATPGAAGNEGHSREVC
jgi:hypothetical protein